MLEDHVLRLEWRFRCVVFEMIDRVDLDQGFFREMNAMIDEI